MMAAMNGKPLALMNADAALLMSNKALLPFAKKILFGFAAGTAQGAKAQVTGNPVRGSILEARRQRGGRIHRHQMPAH